MQLRNVLAVSSVFVGGLFGGLFGWLFPCKHEQTVAVVFQAQTCEESGILHIVCAECDAITEKKEIPAIGHAFSEYKIVSAPGPDGDGLQTRQCKRCTFKESTSIVCSHGTCTVEVMIEPSCFESGREQKTCDLCFAKMERSIPPLPHGNTASFITKDASCSEPGIISSICTVCFDVVEIIEIPPLDHTYGDWFTGEYATPLKDGYNYRICHKCGHKDTENITVVLRDKNLYIPSMGLLCEFGVGAFTQADADAYDVLYTEQAYRHSDPSNPFIIGHNYGSLGKIYNLKIGEHIYIQLDGIIYDYKIVNSEYAVEYNGLAQIGQTTGVSIWDTYSSASHDEEDCRVSAESTNRRNQSDGMTLHMYTCYYGADKPEWQSSHGRSGRWIVIADLVDKIEIST